MVHWQRKGASLKSDTRLLRVVLYEPSGRGGVCHYTHQLGEHLARAGVDVTLITTEDYELKQLERHFKVDYLFTRSWVTRLRLWINELRRNTSARTDRGRKGGEASLARARTVGVVKTGAGYPKLLRNLRLRLRHLRAISYFLLRRPDVVHFQWFVNRLQGYRFINLLRRLRIPAVYTAHDVEPHTTTSGEERVDLQRIYDSVAKIIVHAESNKRELLSLFNVDPSKVAVIPHGSYAFLCAPEPLTKDEARERMGVPQGKRVILFFGLIKRYKGLEYLVDAFFKVRESMDDAFLLIVGDVYAGDSEGYEYYSRLIDGLRDRNDVLCIASYVPLETVGYYLAAADVVVLPYTRTYQSGVLLAAYAAGRPVVVTDTGGLGEVVEVGKSGYVVPPRDVKALARGIIDVLADREQLIAMGEHAKYLARRTYAWDGIASRTIELYQSIAGKRRGVSQSNSPAELDSSAPGMRKAENGKVAIFSTPPPNERG